ncbi:MAG: pyridoxal phosphate-dependent aminotransferase [Limibacillus sp.]
MKLSRRSQVDPFIVMDVMRAAAERAAEGKEVLHLEVGQPGSPAPEAVRRATAQALEGDPIGFTVALGIPALREAIARHYEEAYGVDLDPARVVVTTGSSAAFTLSFLAAFDPGDRVALAAPGYPAYRNILKALDIEPVMIEAEAEDRFQPTPALLDRIEGKLDGLIIASPSNPTGTMIDEPHLKALVDYCRERELRIISDEIYHGITFAGRGVSALELTGDAVVINSFSKYFCMTGWRLGWMVLPEEMLRPIECLAQNLFISPPTLSQVGGVAAFGCKPELDRRVADYAKARALLLERLPKAGLTKLAPADGAFYIYADVGDFTNDSKSWCTRLLNETGIAATPGIDFDPARGHRFVRLSFAGKYEEIEEACERLGEWLA